MLVGMVIMSLVLLMLVGMVIMVLLSIPHPRRC